MIVSYYHSTFCINICQKDRVRVIFWVSCGGHLELEGLWKVQASHSERWNLKKETRRLVLEMFCRSSLWISGASAGLLQGLCVLVVFSGVVRLHFFSCLSFVTPVTHHRRSTLSFFFHVNETVCSTRCTMAAQILRPDLLRPPSLGAVVLFIEPFSKTRASWYFNDQLRKHTRSLMIFKLLCLE